MAADLVFDGHAVSAGATAVVRMPVTTDLSGAELALYAHVVRGRRPGPVLTLFSTLHGGEFLSIEMVRRFIQSLNPEEMAGTVIGLPVGNPVALTDGTRNTRDESDSADLNRIFPGQYNWLTDQLAKTITREILQKTDFLIDMHLGLWGATMGTTGYSVDFSDDEVNRASKNLAHAFGYPLIREFEMVSHFPGPKSACGYAGEILGIPNMVVEIGGSGFGHELEERWIGEVVDGFHNVARHLEILPGQPEVHDEPYVYDLMTRVNPSVGGYLIPDVVPDTLTETVTAGTQLGRVFSPYTFEELEVLEAPVDGRLVMVARPYPVRPGYWAFGIGSQS